MTTSKMTSADQNLKYFEARITQLEEKIKKLEENSEKPNQEKLFKFEVEGDLVKGTAKLCFTYESKSGNTSTSMASNGGS